MRKLTIIFLFLMVNVWFALGWTPPSPITPPDTIPDAVANMNFGILGGNVPGGGTTKCVGIDTDCDSPTSPDQIGTDLNCDTDATPTAVWIATEAGTVKAVHLYFGTSTMTGSQGTDWVMDAVVYHDGDQTTGSIALAQNATATYPGDDSWVRVPVTDVSFITGDIIFYGVSIGTIGICTGKHRLRGGTTGNNSYVRVGYLADPFTDITSDSNHHKGVMLEYLSDS